MAGLERVTAAFGRAETVVIGDAELSILLVKNPAGANEVMRTLALESGELDLLGILNDRTADGRDVSWIWDADFELLAPRVRRVTCAGTRAAELALRLKYAGVDTSRLHLVAGLAPALDAALSDTAAGAAVRDADLHGAARAARGAGRPRARPGVLAHAEERAGVTVIWHDLECGGYVADLPLWRELAASTGGRSSTSARGPAASRSTSPATVTRSRRSTATPSCSMSCVAVRAACS